MTSEELLAELVRKCFSVEPNIMTTLAHDDTQYRPRDELGAVQIPTALDGVEVFVRRTIAIGLDIRARIGPVRMLTEQQARALGWPCARLANVAVVLAWALVLSDGRASCVPVLLEADAAADGLGPQFGGGDLPAIDDLLERFYKSAHANSGAVSRANKDRQETPPRSCRHLRLDAVFADWFGVDVLTAELPVDRFVPKLVSANTRAVSAFVDIITGALERGAEMFSELIGAVRVKTEEDARVAGEPGAIAANTVVLLAAAVQHGYGWTPQVLAPREHAAAELIEATRRLRSEYHEANDCGEAQMAVVYDMRDYVARHHIHVGRSVVQRVAQRLLDADT